MEQLPAIDQGVEGRDEGDVEAGSFRRLSLDDLQTDTEGPSDGQLPAIKSAQDIGSSGAYSKAMRVTGNVRANAETSIVVGTTQSSQKRNALPDNWNAQRVNKPQDSNEYHKSKLQWENQIAKHILAMFATTNAVKDYTEGAALLEFVDVSNPNKTDGGSSSLGTSESRAANLQGDEEFEDDEAGIDADGAAVEDVNADGFVKKNIKKGSKRLRKKKRKQKKNSQTNEKGAGVRSSLKSENYRYVERVMQRIRDEQESLTTAASATTATTAAAATGGGAALAAATAGSRVNTGTAGGIEGATNTGSETGKKQRLHRISNTIKLKGGGELVIRGSPKCFPIWFVSTGDVYADWTCLPGGIKLQAHLNVLYEDQKFYDYLGIIETNIIQLWRSQIYGEEEFTLGSFGLSMEPLASNMNSRVGTARSGRRSGSRGFSRGSRRSGKSRSPGRDQYSSGWGASGEDGGATGSMKWGKSTDSDAQFGNALEWEDDGEGGLVPVIPAVLSYDNRMGGEGNSSPTRKQAATPGKGVTWGADTTTDGAHMMTSPIERRSVIGTMVGDGDIHDGKAGTPHYHFRPHTRDARTPNGSQRKGAVVIDHVVNESILTQEQLVALWKQLILTSIAMGILSVERKNLEQGMVIFKRAENWAKNDDILTDRMIRKEMDAHVRDAISFYFYKKGRSVAAQGYADQALELYEEVGNMDGVAACLLHVAAVYSALSNFKESHKILFQFMAMVESGRLANSNASPKQLCLVAIAYHNLAVVQLKLNMPDLACKNSQNARKIARLCLSYSNRWIDVMQFTHEIAVADIKWELSTKRVQDLTEEQLFVVKELAEALFDPFIDP